MSDMSVLEGELQCWIGSPGQLVPAGYGGDLSSTVTRASHVKTTLGGLDKVQWGRTPAREWSVDVHPWEGDYYHGLESLIWGAYGAPPWAFVSPEMATTNMIPPRASLFEGLTATTSAPRLGAFAGADGTRHPVSLSATEGNVYFGIEAYLVAGLPVTAACYATAGTQIRLHVRDAAGTVLSNTAATATTDGQRVSITLPAAPAGSATARLVVAAGAGPGIVAGPTVTLTDKVLPYSFGRGVDAVMVDGLDSSLFAVDAREGAMSSFNYTVKEIRR